MKDPKVKLNNRIPIKFAYLNRALTWPGVSAAETTLQKIPGIKMYYTPQGLICIAKDKTTIVPHANINNAVVDGALEDEA